MQQIGSLKRQLLEALSAAELRGAAVPPRLRQSALEALGRRFGGCDGCVPALREWDAGGRGAAAAGAGGDAQAAAAPPPSGGLSNELLVALLGAALFPQVANTAVAFESFRNEIPVWHIIGTRLPSGRRVLRDKLVAPSREELIRQNPFPFSSEAQPLTASGHRRARDDRRSPT